MQCVLRLPCADQDMWVAHEADDTRRQKTMEDHVVRSSRSPDGLSYDIRLNIAEMLMGNTKALR